MKTGSKVSAAAGLTRSMAARSDALTTVDSLTARNARGNLTNIGHLLSLGFLAAASHESGFGASPKVVVQPECLRVQRRRSPARTRPIADSCGPVSCRAGGAVAQ